MLKRFPCVCGGLVLILASNSTEGPTSGGGNSGNHSSIRERGVLSEKERCSTVV